MQRAVAPQCEAQRASKGGEKCDANEDAAQRVSHSLSTGHATTLLTWHLSSSNNNNNKQGYALPGKGSGLCQGLRQQIFGFFFGFFGFSVFDLCFCFCSPHLILLFMVCAPQSFNGPLFVVPLPPPLSPVFFLSHLTHRFVMRTIEICRLSRDHRNRNRIEIQFMDIYQN